MKGAIDTINSEKATPIAVVEMGFGNMFMLPIDDAIALARIMANAIKLKYIPDGAGYAIADSRRLDVNLKILSAADAAEIVLNSKN